MLAHTPLQISGGNNAKGVDHVQLQLVVRNPSERVSMWVLWWAKWYWNSLYSEIHGIPISALFGQVSVLVFHLYTVDATLSYKMEGE
jgi:hypothetical protein